MAPLSALHRDPAARVTEDLSLLAGAPPGVAEATIALFPRSTRRRLVANGVISRACGGRGAADIRITPSGWRLIEAHIRAL